MSKMILILVPMLLALPPTAALDETATDPAPRAIYQSHDGTETWLAEYRYGSGEHQGWLFTNLGTQGTSSAWGNPTWGFWGSCIETEGTGAYYATACPSWELQSDVVNGQPATVFAFC